MAGDACARHPSASVVAPCDACGEGLCILCAVPVRGRVLGPRCLEAELGDDALPDAPPVPIDPGPLRRATDLGLLVTLVATALPWSGVGLGAGPFGAWGLVPRWASLVAVSSLAGAGAAAAARLRARRHRPDSDRAAAATSAVALVACLAALVVPPPYTTAAIGPWVAAVAAAFAAATAATTLRRPEEST